VTSRLTVDLLEPFMSDVGFATAEPRSDAYAVL
jgi:hypothetical protein